MVNTEEAEKRISFFKRNYYEIGFIVMAIVIGYLFVGQKQLERDMRNYLIGDRTAAFEKMNISTDVIRQNISVMKEVIDYLKDQGEALRRIERENQERNLRRQ